MDIESIKNNKQIALAIALKYSQLKRLELENLEIQQLINYLFQHKWRHNTPQTISCAVVEIMNAKADHIVAYLSQHAVMDSKNNNLGDYGDLFRQGAVK